MKKSIKQYIVAVVIGLGLVVGVSSLQAAWTLPTGSPPNGNVDAPINIGLNQQFKLGQLSINTDTVNPFTVGLSVFGKSIFNGPIQIADTNAEGKVLTADAIGNASWQTPGVTTPTHSWTLYKLVANEGATASATTVFKSENSMCVLASLDTGGCDTGAKTNIKTDTAGNWEVSVTAVGDCDKQAEATYICTAF